MAKLRVYVSGALSDVPNPQELKRFYEDIGMLCQGMGVEPYVPHLKADPIKHPHIDPKDVYWMDRKEVEASDLIIAYVGVPSLGVGGEQECALRAGVPVILLYEKGKYVSRWARGHPSVIGHLIFTDQDDALIQLRAFLEKYITEFEA